MDLRLDGKVALVTGGSRGIGRAVAARLAASGARVMISARKQETLDAAAAALAAEGAEVAAFVANAGDPDAAEACVAATVERFGGLDVLVNNAATNPYLGRMIDIDAARAEKTVAVNQQAVVTWTQCAWRAAMHTNGGSVVNVSSIGGMSVEPGIGWYNVTKAAVLHITKQLAYELGPGVRVNAVAPGLVKTDFARALWERGGDAVAARLPLKRIGEPDDIAGAVVFLCSEAASWITGATLVVDGGAMSM
ncbi:MAG TPA: SDR family oxidoreductase, partial [Acidimicrobiales bacterium]|nr:SDR family oxidoreductase [Acidimicrobiales bacterium]